MATTKLAKHQAMLRDTAKAAKKAAKEERKRMDSARVLVVDDEGKSRRSTVGKERKRIERENEQNRRQRSNETIVSYRMSADMIAKLERAASALGCTRSAATRLAVAYLLKTFKDDKEAWAADLEALDG